MLTPAEEQLYQAAREEVLSMLESLACRAESDIPKIWALMQEGVRGLVIIVETMQITGREKKEFALKLSKAFYRALGLEVDIPHRPCVVEDYIEPTLRWMIDHAVTHLNTEGWPNGIKCLELH